MITRKEKQAREFITLLPFLEPEEFLGVAKLLGVALWEEPTGDSQEKEPREASLIIDDVIAKFGEINKHKQRELLSLVRPVVKERKKAKQGEKKKNGTTATI